MSESLDTINNLPDVSFIDNITLEEVEGKLVSYYEEKYKSETGKTLTLSKTDPNKIILLACSQLLNLCLQNIDKAGKMNLLKYTYGDYLDNVAIFKKITRKAATSSYCNIKFTLSAVRSSATGIPSGTRVTPDNEIYFATDEYVEIAAGESSVTVRATCTEAGIAGNEFEIGEINILVDPIAFISEVSNTNIASGGSEIESDDDLKLRTYLAPSSYSTTGTEDSYIYKVQECDSNIGDVKVTVSSAGVVDVRFIMDDGSLPSSDEITTVSEYLADRSRHTLTDNDQVSAPDTVSFSIDVTYYINSSDKNSAEEIQSEVNAAITSYISWQQLKIGRDINPDELLMKMKNAGAKRVVINAPTYIQVTGTSKAVFSGTSTVTYGGLEDD